ncbi:MAG: DUF3764 family protein [Rhodospirillales bacterium]
MMAQYALVKFKINNSFYDWEQAFYASQPMARKAGVLEIFHGKKSNDDTSVAVLLLIESKEKMDNFLKNAGEQIQKSGHIIESTEVEFYDN